VTFFAAIVIVAEHLSVIWTGPKDTSIPLPQIIAQYQESPNCVIVMREVQQAFADYQGALSAWTTFRNILHKRCANHFTINNQPILSFFAGESRVLPMRNLQENFKTSS
jgi:hypothetical protein